MKINKKTKEWLQRYAPAEVCGIIGGQLFSFLGLYFTGSREIAAFTGSIGDTGSIYTFVTAREVITDRKKGKTYGFFGIVKTFRNLIAEFGVAEIFDVLLIRPFCMYFFPLMISNFQLGIFVGGMVANLSFYGMAIIGYEVRKKYLK